MEIRRLVLCGCCMGDRYAVVVLVWFGKKLSQFNSALNSLNIVYSNSIYVTHKQSRTNSKTKKLRQNTKVDTESELN